VAAILETPVYIWLAAANCRHRCGAGERDSSLRIAVSAWNPRRMLPRASRSPARFCAFCHVCWSGRQRAVDPQSAARLPGPGCIVVGSVPDAAEGCLARPASSGRSRRGASPTVGVSDARAQEQSTRTKSIDASNHPASRPCTWGMQGMTACGRIAFRVSGGSSFETEAVASLPSSQPSNNARSSTTARLDRLGDCHPSFDQS
jgi:hypothetical protein